MSLGYQYFNKNKISLSIGQKYKRQNILSHFKSGGMARYACPKALLTVEAAAVLPYFVCFMVFILYFFRILQVQAGVAQALQYAGRRAAAEYVVQEETEGSDQAGIFELWKAKMLFEQQLKKQKCPLQYVKRGMKGISLNQSDLSGNYVELKAVYRMKLPIGLLGNIQYQIIQESKCRKWTGYQQGQDMQEDDTWLYYTEHGTVYHASRNCTHLDLSIRGVTYEQAGNSRNQSGGKYHKCEKCGISGSLVKSQMVYITDYGDRYHSSLTCSGLKRSIYMIQRSKATDKRMCSKCGR